MPIKRRLEQTSLTTIFTVPVPLLGEADLGMLQRAMAQIAPDWAVALEGICAGEATLVLVPEDGDDRSGPSFVISRETYGLRVDQVHWDAVTEVGVFASLSSVLEVLKLRLSFFIDSTMAASSTIH
jgi:hypothetical protein